MFFHEKEISNLPWKSLDINYVIEATGKYKTFEDLNAHIIAGAKKVILSAPSEVDSIKTVVIGVNDHILDGTETIISNASCTTNNAAPMMKVIDELCGIKQATTTIHSIRQIKVYMINHTKIYVEHEGRVNLLFQLLPSSEGIKKIFLH
jgi:glyceraldehyde 3-phosphate dehydrogenase